MYWLEEGWGRDDGGLYCGSSSINGKKQIYIIGVRVCFFMFFIVGFINDFKSRFR